MEAWRDVLCARQFVQAVAKASREDARTWLPSEGRAGLSSGSADQRHRRTAASAQVSARMHMHGSSIPSLKPRTSSERFEGIAFSTSGNIIGVADPDSNAVHLFRRGEHGGFDEVPYCSVGG